jgi:hypothetical protein
MGEEKKGLWDQFEGKWYQYIIPVLLLIVLVVPYYNPVPLPLKIAPETRAMYDYINTLTSDDVVCVEIDFSPGAWPELGGAFIAVLRHLFEIQNVKVVCVGTYGAQAPAMWLKGMEEVDTTGKTYGEDWVHLGYVPGGKEVVLSAIASSFRVVETDYRGNAYDDLPLMQTVEKMSDLALWIDCDWNWNVDTAVRQVSPNTNLVEVTIGGMISTVLPYIASGQILGYVGATTGGATYEALIGRPGEASSALGMMSFGHVLVVVLMVVGNVVFVLRKFGKGGS